MSSRVAGDAGPSFASRLEENRSCDESLYFQNLTIIKSSKFNCELKS